MNLLQLDTKILQLINQYSINGSLVGVAQNQDYLLRTRNLVDTCQKELANIRKIPDTIHTLLDQVSTHGTSYNEKYKIYTEIALPTDFKELKDIWIENEFYSSVTDYKFEGKLLLIKSNLVGDLAINYYKYPTTIDVNTVETVELEIDIDAQELIPYYVAGIVYLEDNPTIATMLLNMYESKKSGIRDILPDTPVIIENIYSGFM